MHAPYFNTLEKFIDKKKSITIAVAYPMDEMSLKGIVQAVQKYPIHALLFGDAETITAIAKKHNLSLNNTTIIQTKTEQDAIEKAVKSCSSQESQALMKGKVHTDNLIRTALNKEFGLRSERRFSHVFVMDVPAYHKPLLLTDCAINIFPDFDSKVDILKNAIDLAHSMKIKVPKVAILSALESIYPKIPTTLEAAALCKMADRKQITGAIIDGPLAFDNAISKKAAEIKGIESQVAGDADILMVPNLEAGNMLAKQLTYFAGAKSAGLMLGAKVPIILTSRADNEETRAASILLACITLQHKEK